METLEALDTRKSVRGYLDKPVEKEKLDAILKYGNKAPIAGQIYMTAITNKGLLERINETGKQAALASGNEFMIRRVSMPGYKLTYGAPALIVISAPNAGYCGLNTGCAAENICIAATGLGLGSCFLAGVLLAFQFDPGLLAELKIPEGFVPQCGVIIGYEGDSAIPSVPRAEVRNISYIE